MRSEPPVEMAKPLTVLQLGSPAGLFGAERWILALLRNLQGNHIKSIVGVIQDEFSTSEPPLCAKASELGFETMSIRSPGRLSYSAIEQLRDYINRHHVDVLHTHFYKTTVLGALAVRGTKCKLLATPHGWSAGAGIKVQAYEWLERITFRWADAIAPLSEDLERGLRKLPWISSSIVTIPNGVDLSEVTASTRISASVLAARQKGEFVVGYIGQLIQRKRVDTLIEAFSKLDIAKKKLFIVGDGEQRKYLEVLANQRGVMEQVCFTGFRDDRLEFLRGFDVLVLPSELEGIPRCLMEGMAACVPIVGTDIPGIQSLIENKKNGWLFAIGDAQRLSEILEDINRGGEIKQAIVSAASRKVSDSFTASRMAAQYLMLFSELAERSPKASRANDRIIP